MGMLTFLVFAFELRDKVVDKTVVKVLTTQVSVTGGRLDLKDTLLNSEERDIEGSSSKIEDEDVALTLNLLVQTVCNGSCSWLVDDSEDVQASNETSILGGLTLRVVEVGWDSDDSVVDSSTEVCLSSLSHLDQDHGGDLLRSEVLHLTLKFDLNDWLSSLVNDLEWEVLHISLNLSISELATDQSLCVEDCVGWVHGDLVLGGISNETLGVGEGNERRSCSVTLIVCNNLNTVISVDTDT